MCTHEQKLKIIDSLDVIDEAECKFEALDSLMVIAAQAGGGAEEFTTKNLGNLAWLIRDAIVTPMIEAGDAIYKIIKEEVKS